MSCVVALAHNDNSADSKGHDADASNYVRGELVKEIYFSQRTQTCNEDNSGDVGATGAAFVARLAVGVAVSVVAAVVIRVDRQACVLAASQVQARLAKRARQSCACIGVLGRLGGSGCRVRG